MTTKFYTLYKEHFHYIYVALLATIVVAMPHSRGLLSSAQIALLFSWILDGDLKKKINILKNNKQIIVFISIFLLHIVGLLYTNNYNYALNDLKIKLPLLILPLIIGTSKKLSYNEIKIIISLFTISILFKTLYGLIIISGLSEKEIINVHELAGKFSHIRYSLMLNIAIFMNVYLVFISKNNEKIKYRLFRLFIILWFTLFLFILHSVTGWVVFLFLILFTFFYLALSSEKSILKKYGLYLSLTVAIIIFSYLIFSITKYNKTDIIDTEKIELKTKSGNKYYHNFKSNERENGHFVNLYLCEKELKDTWNNVSKYNYNGKDNKNQNIKYTLIRYLTSKNYKKDKEGVLKLSKKDIINIQNGYANYIYENKYAIYPKIYETLWQLERYYNGGNPEKHSVSQRFEFVKVAKNIIKNNFWFGVGTGDIKDEFDLEYKKTESRLSANNRLRSHNQYVTFFVTFGLFGFLWFLFAFIYPPLKEQKYKDYIFLSIFIIMAISMMNEDTLETQMGATTFAFFISLFLFGHKTRKHK